VAARPREKNPDPKTPEGQFALYLGHLMRSKGVSEEALATAAEVSRASVFNWLRGDFVPAVRLWAAIAERLGLDDWRKLVPPDKFLKTLDK